MTNIDHLTPNQDERVMAALAHVAVILPTMGIIAPIVIWATQKEKSQYVAFQALQALAYQLCMIAAFLIGIACYMCSFFSTFISTFSTIPLQALQVPQWVESFIPLSFVIPMLVFGGIFLGGFIFIVYGIIAAFMAFQGKPFRYIIIGRRVERLKLQKRTGA